MYNESQKKRYVEENLDRNLNLDKIVLPMFKLSAELEEFYGRDISNFSTAEIKGFYSSLFTASLERLLLINSHLKLYTTWCLEQNLVDDAQNHFEEFKMDLLELCVNKSSKDRRILFWNDIEKDVLSLPNPSDQFLVVALMCGIGGKMCSDFFDLTVDKFHDGVVELPNRTIKVPELLKNLAIESASEYKYYSYGTIRTDFQYYDESDDRIVKRMYNANAENDHAQSYRIYNKLRRLKDYMGLEAITTKGLRDSGRLQFIRDCLKSDDTISTPEEAIIKYRKEIETMYGVIYSIPRFLLKFGAYLE